jgi:RNA polymerase sigma factor (sigma-70 family)
MDTEEREEFISWALFRMVESEYAVVTRWRGDSSWSSYLHVVSNRLLLDYRNHRWGKWRLSTVARRGSRAAQLLDVLIHRDGFSTREAVEFVLHNHRTSLDRVQLLDLAESLPARQERRMGDFDSAPEPEAPEAADQVLFDDDRRRVCAMVEAALDLALDGLDASEVLLLQMRYCRDAEANEIARRFGIPRRRVYQRLETALARLRRALLAADIQATEALDVVGTDAGAVRLNRFRCSPPDTAAAADRDA